MAASNASPAQLAAVSAPEASAGDLEKGVKKEETHEHSDNEFSGWYYVIYLFSILILCQGLLMFLKDPDHVKDPKLAKVITAGSLCTGTFLLLNADLFVTMIRLRKEVRAFKANNSQFKSTLQKQKQEIQKLKAAEKAFKKLDAKFQGNLDKAAETLSEMKSTAKDRIGVSIKTVSLVRRLEVVKADQMAGFLDQVADLYIRIFPDIYARVEEIKKGMMASPKYWKDQSMLPVRIGEIFEKALFEDLSKIKETTKSIADVEGDFAVIEG